MVVLKTPQKMLERKTEEDADPREYSGKPKDFRKFFTVSGLG